MAVPQAGPTQMGHGAGVSETAWVSERHGGTSRGWAGVCQPRWAVFRETLQQSVWNQNLADSEVEMSLRPMGQEASLGGTSLVNLQWCGLVSFLVGTQLGMFLPVC